MSPLLIHRKSCGGDRLFDKLAIGGQPATPGGHGRSCRESLPLAGRQSRSSRRLWESCQRALDAGRQESACVFTVAPHILRVRYHSRHALGSFAFGGTQRSRRRLNVASGTIRFISCLCSVLLAKILLAVRRSAAFGKPCTTAAFKAATIPDAGREFAGRRRRLRCDLLRPWLVSLYTAFEGSTDPFGNRRPDKGR